MPSQSIAPVPFAAQVELLRLFLARRAELVERIAALLNAQRQPPHYLQDLALLSRELEDCFFTLPRLTAEQRALRGQLDEAHRASGFTPRRSPGMHNDLIDAAELMRRAFHMWQQTRWPGHHGRVGYAQTLFGLFVLRRSMQLSIRIWDSGEPSERLAQLQGVLDELARTTPSEQPVLVRDARWLFGLALSPTTDELHGYLEVAQRIAETLPAEDRLAIDGAGVRMAGGHLRSQLRHVSTQQGVPLDDRSLTLSTRRSNALDLATLLQSLVPQLAAYEHAAGERRRELADAICQGISPDPELFVNRVDLLRPYSMLEHLFVATDGNGGAEYTPMGRRHLRLVDEYEALIGRVAPALHDDCAQFRPIPGSYSPYGALYGFSSQLLEHMALKASQPDAVARFGLEDVFVAGGADKLAWVGGWRKLPHVPRGVAKLFEYPQAFAEAVFARIERALRERVAAAGCGARRGRLFVGPAEGAATIAELPAAYRLSSDKRLVAAGEASAYDEAQLLHSRNEGELLVSYETSGGWCAITKDVLGDVVGAGRDARITDLPAAAASVLELTCPGCVVR